MATGRFRNCGVFQSIAGLPPAPLPDAPAPMLCTLVAEPFDDDGWILEPKFDGLRVLCRFDGRRLTLLSRNRQCQNFQFPDVVDALRPCLSRPAVLDGELVCFDEQGRSSFRALQQRFHLKDPGEIQARAERHPAFLQLFDILYFDRHDVTGLPLGERKELLRATVRWSARVRFTEFRRGGGKALLRDACRRGEEGIVGKRLDGLYVAGRGESWVKIKCVGRQEFVVGGFTDPQRARRPGGAARRRLRRRGRPPPLRRQSGHRLHQGNTPRPAATPGKNRTARFAIRPGRGAAWRARPLGQAAVGRRDRLRRMDAERPAADAALRGAARRQGAEGVPPRTAQACRTRTPNRPGGFRHEPGRV